MKSNVFSPMQLQDIYKDIRAKLPSGEIRTALEIGPGKGDFSHFLIQNGVQVTAVDIERSAEVDPAVRFEQMPFENYHTDEVFDLVHARNVIPFLKDKPGELKRMLFMGKYVFFTFFGPHDPWAALGRTATKEEMIAALQNAKILYFKEEEFEGYTMNREVKPWHIFTYLVETNVK